MKIRMLVQMSGTRNGQKWPPKGEPVDLPTGEAQHLVASGIAEEVPAEGVSAEVETATAPVAEVSTPPAAQTPSRRRSRQTKGDRSKE